MKLSDYVVERLAHLGVTHCFSVTGGGAMHLNDSFGKSQSFTNIYNHHEQASAMAAEGFARIANSPAAVCVTTGPGGINSLNGIFGAYTDSIPMIVIAGQVKRETIVTGYPNLAGLRQLGDQEARSLEIVRPITKFAVQVLEPEDIGTALDAAYLHATTGRPGPVWVEIPVDVQAAEVDLDPSTPLAVAPDELRTSGDDLGYVRRRLSEAKRPVILAGTGVRLANQKDSLKSIAHTFNVPVVTAWTHDIFDNHDELFGGRAGTIGTRPGNMVIQNSDLVLVLGSRLNIRQVSYAWDSFAPKAEVVVVDVDDAELVKPFPRVDRGIHADLRDFMPGLQSMSPQELDPSRQNWLSWVKNVNAKYRSKRIDYPEKDGFVNPYHLVFDIFEKMPPNSVVVSANASACIIPFQVGSLTGEDRLFSNSGSASMGFELPAAIGAAAANPGAKVICLAGDGSIMMNIQELATLNALGLDVAVIVLDNNGYLSIKQTQNNFFQRSNGSSPESGVHFPDLEKVGSAFGIKSLTLDGYNYNLTALADFLNSEGPRLLVVKLDPDQEFIPRLKSKMVDGHIQTPELDDMYPHLDPSELSSIRESAISIS